MKIRGHLMRKEKSLRDQIYVTKWDYGVRTITPVEWFYRYEPLIGFHGEYLGVL
jgi:hypothetical protein